jgi:hypothetical protein
MLGSVESEQIEKERRDAKLKVGISLKLIDVPLGIRLPTTRNSLIEGIRTSVCRIGYRVFVSKSWIYKLL